jgi:hypothetical protein
MPRVDEGRKRCGLVRTVTPFWENGIDHWFLYRIELVVGHGGAERLNVMLGSHMVQ